MDVQTALATIRVHAHPGELAGWEVFEWFTVSARWMPHRDDAVHERRYDTGHRA